MWNTNCHMWHVPLSRSLLKGGWGLSLRDTIRLIGLNALVDFTVEWHQEDVPLVCGCALQRSPPGFFQHWQRRTHFCQTDQWACRERQINHDSSTITRCPFKLACTVMDDWGGIKFGLYFKWDVDCFLPLNTWMAPVKQTDALLLLSDF